MRQRCIQLVLQDNFSMKTRFLHSFNSRRYFLGLAVLACTALHFTAAYAQTQAQLNLPRTSLQIGMYRIDAQVAQTPEQRQIGLMWRKSMPAHEGMLFVFEQPSQQCFWMKNTPIALTAAFIEDDASIVNLADMKPQTTQPHCSARPVRYVLEMNAGWFERRKIKAGTKIQGLPAIR
jgi:uncharacterized protein